MTAFDDLSLLRTFVCIVECGSISAGARRLKTPQPTLSRHLLLLEEHCGAALLKGRRFRSDPDEHLVQKNDRFSELSADRVFSLQNRLLAVRNTRLEKQSSIYSRQMSKLNSLCFVRTGFNGIPTRARHFSLVSPAGRTPF